MANSCENNGNSDRLYFGGAPKITVDGECSHEIKTCLLLGRKAMSNLGSILKSRDIILPTKVSLVKAAGVQPRWIQGLRRVDGVGVERLVY